jgi:phosphoglycolate phosphatase-like HAD superfamily hydrolase
MKAFIFDLDGTLVDSNELHVDSWDAAFQYFGKQFPREQLQGQIGKGSDHYLPEFLSREEIVRFGKELDKYRSELFKKDYLPLVRPFPRVRALFKQIREAGGEILLATSGKKSETQHYIDLLEIGDLISGKTTADDAEQSKPEPDILMVALAKLRSVQANESLLIGDTRFDMEAARKAGIPRNRCDLRRNSRVNSARCRRIGSLPKPSGSLGGAGFPS